MNRCPVGARGAESPLAWAGPLCTGPERFVARGFWWHRSQDGCRRAMLWGVLCSPQQRERRPFVPATCDEPPGVGDRQDVQQRERRPFVPATPPQQGPHAVGHRPAEGAQALRTCDPHSAAPISTFHSPAEGAQALRTCDDGVPRGGYPARNQQRERRPFVPATCRALRAILSSRLPAEGAQALRTCDRCWAPRRGRRCRPSRGSAGPSYLRPAAHLGGRGTQRVSDPAQRVRCCDPWLSLQTARLESATNRASAAASSLRRRG